MKPYLTKATAPRRMTRKNSRRDIFLANKKAAKARRKAERLERKSLAIAENNAEWQ